MRTTLAAIFMTLSCAAAAEPFLAVETGFHCAQCHISPSGGGSRNAYGALFLQTQLPSTPAPAGDVWTGTLGERFTLGADLRTALREIDIDGVDSTRDFTTDRLSLYLGARLNDRVQIYVDQQMAPGGSLNRSAWMKLDLNDSLYLRAGKIFLPFGLRLEDDSAFIRQQTNINFNTADHGIELGLIRAAWRAQLAVTNGTGGGAEIDDGKQLSLFASYVRPAWRIGASFNSNHTDFVDREIAGLFAGLRTGPVRWLLEFDRIGDRQSGVADRDLTLLFAESNIRLARGHYLKVTAERTRDEQDDDQDLTRYAIEYQHFPLSYTQLRLGARQYDSDLADPFFSRRELFAQLHVYF